MSVIRKYLKYGAYMKRYKTLSRRTVSERLWSDYQRGSPEFARTLEGFYLYLIPNDRLSFLIAASGTYNDLGDRKMVALFKNLTKNSNLVVDVGANIGWYTFLAAKKARKVVAFEPEPCNFSMLCKSREKNGFQNVELIKCALSDTIGKINLYVSPNPGHHSIVRHVGAMMSVQATTLDAVFPSETIDLLKIDAEGAEPLILRGAERLIKEKRIKAVIMEWNPETWNDTRPLHQFEILTTNGRVLANLPSSQCNLYLRK